VNCVQAKGRFLKEDNRGQWKAIPATAARIKVAQALQYHRREQQRRSATASSDGSEDVADSSESPPDDDDSIAREQALVENLSSVNFGSHGVDDPKTEASPSKEYQATKEKVAEDGLCFVRMGIESDAETLLDNGQEPFTHPVELTDVKASKTEFPNQNAYSLKDLRGISDYRTRDMPETSIPKTVTTPLPCLPPRAPLPCLRPQVI